MLERYCREIRVLDHFEITQSSRGHVILTTKITDTALNYYGNAHGGYLFTLCDQVAGLVSLSTGSHVVTIQSSVNYMKAGLLGQKLSIEGRCVHDGRTTKMIEVMITNPQNQILVKSSFTMFVTGTISEEGD